MPRPLSLACLALPAAAGADPVSFAGDGALGDYTGTVAYSAGGPGAATLTVSLTNTSPADNGGYLTGFVFNNPLNAISGVGLSGGPFELLGSAPFQDGIQAGPYGTFDVGAALGGSFQGGGSPTAGVGVGETRTFTFSLTGTGLDALTAADFLTTVSQGGQAAGQGVQAFVARFRGFEDDGSDKVPAGPPPTLQTPEPGTLTLAGLGLAGVAARHLRRRRGGEAPAP